MLRPLILIVASIACQAAVPQQVRPQLAAASEQPAASSVAGGSGPATSLGATYAARLRARVLPNLTLSELVGNDTWADVEVHLAEDGTITSARVVRSNGVKAWNSAVLRALERTKVLPRDTDGQAPSTIILNFSAAGSP